MITKEQAEDIRARNALLETWIDSIRGKNGWASYKPEDKPLDVPSVTNEERSALEVYDFMVNPPIQYFLYINSGKHTATTWPGDKLGDVSFGREYKVPACGGFPSIRVPVTVRAINGFTYTGTYFKSSGDYARVRRNKKA